MTALFTRHYTDTETDICQNAEGQAGWLEASQRQWRDYSWSGLLADRLRCGVTPVAVTLDWNWGHSLRRRREEGAIPGVPPGMMYPGGHD